MRRRASVLVGYWATVPTLVDFRYRWPSGVVSEKRNCQTSSLCALFFLVKDPYRYLRRFICCFSPFGLDATPGEQSLFRTDVCLRNPSNRLTVTGEELGCRDAHDSTVITKAVLGQRTQARISLAGRRRVVRVSDLFGLTGAQDLSEERLDFVEAIVHPRCHPTLRSKRVELPIPGFRRWHER